MFCTVTVAPSAHLSIRRMCRNRPPAERTELRACANLLAHWLQYNPNLQGKGSKIHVRKTLICGPLFAFYEVRPPIERHVIIWDYGRNPKGVTALPL